MTDANRKKAIELLHEEIQLIEKERFRMLSEEEYREASDRIDAIRRGIVALVEYTGAVG